MQAALYKLDGVQQPLPLKFIRNPKARRYILRMGAEGVARVTIPRGGSFEQALRFAERNKAWIEKQIGAAQARATWTEGTLVRFRGDLIPIQINGTQATLGTVQCNIHPDLRTNLEAGLRAAAERELTARTQELAAAYGLIVRTVRVRNQRTRWGSCSSKGTICLNWRLIQTPESVRDYIVIHELMHLREMNHSARFWQHVETACPFWREAERWLRKNGSLLR